MSGFGLALRFVGFMLGQQHLEEDWRAFSIYQLITDRTLDKNYYRRCVWSCIEPKS